MDDAYTLSVCHNKKIMHYRIIHHDDDTYSFRDPDRADGDHLERNGPDHIYEKFPSLHDLINSYHHKQVSDANLFKYMYSEWGTRKRMLWKEILKWILIIR